MASNSRGISETSVVLPAPVEPTIATVSPRSARNEMSVEHGVLGAGVGELDALELQRAEPRANSVTGCSGRASVDSLASTSLMRSAETAARGIMIVVKAAMSTPPRMMPTYCMNAKSVPISTSPSFTSMAPNQMTPTTVTFSTSMNSGKRVMKRVPTRRPTSMMSVLAAAERAAPRCARARTRARRGCR